MNLLALRLKKLGKTSNFSMKMLCLALTLCVLAVGTLSFAIDSPTDNYIKFSKSSDRSNPVTLNGSTVSGNIYVHLADTTINSAMYFLDTNGNFANSESITSMSSFPQDLMYRNSDGTAKPFDTTTLTEGKHTLVVRVRIASTGKYVLHTSVFTVDNIPDRALNQTVRVSINPHRLGDGALDSAKLSGNVYIFLDPKDIQSATYFLDTNGNYNNSVMTSGSKTAPFDFKYRNSDGTAKPFDTRTVADGKHVLAVTTRLISTGKYVRHIIEFTVDNTTPTPTINTTKPTTVTTTPTTYPNNGETGGEVVDPPIFGGGPIQVAPRFAGDVAPGSVRWGSSIGGNGDPVARHGTEIANRMGIRRTFWNVNQRTSMVATAKADLAAGRLPWVSVKLNGSWKENGDGLHDATMLAILNDLSALNGPVWFTAHHEPEGGCRDGCAQNGMDDIGGPSEWLRMQANTSKLLKQLRAQGKGNNIAFAPILMGWTFQSQSGRTPSQWFQAGIWDFAGIDAYGEGEGTTPFLQTNGMAAARLFYGERGLKIAVGEWGIRNQNHTETNAGEIPTAQEQQDALTRFNSAYTGALASASDGKGAQVIGLSYFDSGLNSPNGSWELTYLQLPRFRELVSAPTSIRATQFK